ncbi:30S ribosomal protein S6 [Candidatus Saccharibacteria bacterium]|nr:30S ribosomal protein S6 [Candidatus Saccharibacteria bacterium]MBR0482652.1 30S ribosomal protein S6 [Candidatus Saccharibacteria bacterium]
MREYELTVLVHPDLEMNLEAATDKVKALIEANGGKITKENNEGKKKLAYQIKKQDFAVYYYYEVELPAPAPAKISSVLNITDEVIRYLLVAKDPRREKMLAKRQERKAQEEASKEEE